MANPLSPIWSNIANRKDHANQKFWTEFRQYGYVTGGTPAQANGYVVLGPDGKIDPSLLPASGSTVRVNGTPITNPNFNDTTPAAPVGMTNVIWQFDAFGNVSAAYATSGTTVAFGSITSGTNTTATMVVGSGATLTVTGTGVIEATELATNTATPVQINLSAPTHQGQLLISQPGNATALWADPFVQGPWVDGTPVVAPGAMGDGTSNIQPVLVAGKGTSLSGKDGKMHSIPLTADGDALYTLWNPEESTNVGYFDPYQRLRVSQPVTIFDESAEFIPAGAITGPPTPTFPTQFTFTTTGSGAFSRPAGFANITGTVAGDAGASAIWQSRAYFINQLGKGFIFYMTGNLGANIVNVITRMGGFDADRGVFFEQNGVTGTLRIVTRANGIDVGIDQANWNLDPLNGTGNSGVTLNMANTQFMVIDLGIGRVRFGFAINGVVYYCHALSVTNNIVATAHAQQVFPFRFEISNAGASAGGSVFSSYVSVITESGYQDNPSAFAFSVNSGPTLKTGITAATPILSIRPKLLFGGGANRSFVTLRDFGVFNLGQACLYQLVWNGVLTGASFNPADPQSSVEYDTAATSLSGGRVVDSGFIAAFSNITSYSRDQFPFRLPFTLQDIAGSSADIYTIVVTPLSGTATAAGSFKWQELR